MWPHGAPPQAVFTPPRQCTIWSGKNIGCLILITGAVFIKIVFI